MAAPTTAPSSKTPPAAKAPESKPEPKVARERVKHENLAEALSAFQAEIPNVRKSSTAVIEGKSSYSYSYADLSDVTEAAMPLLGRHGLAFTARPTLHETGFVLIYELLHESGEKIEGVYPLPSPTGRAQDMGSAITYARRYAFTAVTGIAPGGDDDDAASAPPARSGSQQQMSAPPPEGWQAEILETDTLDGLTAIYERASSEGWAAGNKALIDGLNARKLAILAAEQRKKDDEALADAARVTGSATPATEEKPTENAAPEEAPSAPASSEATATEPPSDAELRSATE